MGFTMLVFTRNYTSSLEIEDVLKRISDAFNVPVEDMDNTKVINEFPGLWQFLSGVRTITKRTARKKLITHLQTSKCTATTSIQSSSRWSLPTDSQSYAILRCKPLQQCCDARIRKENRARATSIQSASGWIITAEKPPRQYCDARARKENSGVSDPFEEESANHCSFYTGDVRE